MGYTKEKRIENKYKELSDQILKEICQEEDKKFNSGSLDIRIGAEKALKRFVKKIIEE